MNGGTTPVLSEKIEMSVQALEETKQNPVVKIPDSLFVPNKVVRGMSDKGNSASSSSI